MRKDWEQRLSNSSHKAEFKRITSGALPANFDEVISNYKKELAKNPPPLPKSTRLDDLTTQANQLQERSSEERKLYNLSLKQIGYRISDTWFDIMDDTLKFNPQNGARGIVEIFTKEDRLIYLGMTLMLFTIVIVLLTSI